MHLFDLILYSLPAACGIGGLIVGCRATPSLERKVLRILILAAGAFALEVISSVLVASSATDFTRLSIFYAVALSAIVAVFSLFLGLSLMFRKGRRGGGLRIAIM